MSELFFALLAAQGDGAAVTPVAPPARAFRIGANTNIVVDANSYYAHWVYDPINAVGAFGQLLRERGASSKNVAIAGQTWRNMRMNLTDMVNSFDPAKDNVLVCGETRNFVAQVSRRPDPTEEVPNPPEDTIEAWSARALSTVIKEATSYIAAAQAAVRARYGKGFDKVVLCGTIPNSTLGDEAWKGFVPEMNQVLINFDEYARAHYREMGADAFADFRTNTTWFGGDGTTKPGFAQTQATVYEQLATGEWVHPTGAARDAFAGIIADAVKKLEA